MEGDFCGSRESVLADAAGAGAGPDPKRGGPADQSFPAGLVRPARNAPPRRAARLRGRADRHDARTSRRDLETVGHRGPRITTASDRPAVTAIPGLGGHLVAESYLAATTPQ